MGIQGELNSRSRGRGVKGGDEKYYGGWSCVVKRKVIERWAGRR